jgi:6-phosphogluconolactonase/glucosamine-6-phosphate isomerase/deaminase
VWVLVSGEVKKKALENSLVAGGVTPLARVLQSRKNTEIFTDFDLA